MSSSKKLLLTIKFYPGEKAYELSNHLGNVLVTISDKRIAKDDNSDGTIDYYTTDVKSAADYYAFGMQMPGRVLNTSTYRYGFNGNENDKDVKGDGNQQDYGMHSLTILQKRFKIIRQP